MRKIDLDREIQTKPTKIPKEFHRQKKPFQTDQHLCTKEINDYW